MFVHNVFFWLKPESTTQQCDQLLADCREILGAISSVRKLHAGLPAGTPRRVVDNSYAVGITVVFDDVAGHDAYHVDPLHDSFLARNNDVWDRVTVYDFIE